MHLLQPAVHGGEYRGGCVVYPEPEDAAHGIGEPAPALGYEHKTGLLGGGGALIHVLLPLILPDHRPPTVGAGAHASAGILAHIQRGIFQMVAHGIHHLVHCELVVWLHPERHTMGKVLPHSVVEVLFHKPGH